MGLWQHLRREAGTTALVGAWHGDRGPATPPMATDHAFAGWTAGLFVGGTVRGVDRLSDVLNRREYIRVRDAIVRPTGSREPAAGPTAPEVVFDPFDFDFVVAEPIPDGPQRSGRHVHKLPYAVRVDGERFTIWGSIWVYPERDPELAIRGSAALFIPITRPHVERDGRPVTSSADAILVNRLAIRSLRRLDLPTEPPLLISRPGPGASAARDGVTRDGVSRRATPA